MFISCMVGSMFIVWYVFDNECHNDALTVLVFFKVLLNGVF